MDKKNRELKKDLKEQEIEDFLKNPKTSSCKDIEDLLVDFCEDMLTLDSKEKVSNHLEVCSSCMNEFKNIKALLTKKEKMPDESYFEKLAEKIDNKITVDLSECERVQNYIVDLIFGDIIPLNIKEHLDNCNICQQELLRTKKIVENLKDLSIPLPSESFFKTQLSKIDRAIDTLPNYRLTTSSHNLKNYLDDLMTTIKLVVLRPTTAMAAAIAIILIFITGKFYNSNKSIDSVQLSEAINESNIAATEKSYIGASISTPTEDETIEIKSVGTAKKEEKSN
jgi:hypothetical protein